LVVLVSVYLLDVAAMTVEEWIGIFLGFEEWYPRDITGPRRFFFKRLRDGLPERFRAIGPSAYVAYDPLPIGLEGIDFVLVPIEDIAGDLRASLLNIPAGIQHLVIMVGVPVSLHLAEQDLPQ